MSVCTGFEDLTHNSLVAKPKQNLILLDKQSLLDREFGVYLVSVFIAFRPACRYLDEKSQIGN
jgi:hypothetical protein